MAWQQKNGNNLDFRWNPFQTLESIAFLNISQCLQPKEACYIVHNRSIPFQPGCANRPFTKAGAVVF